MKAILERLLHGDDLSEDEAGDLLRHLTDPDVAEASKGAALAALRAKGETATEVRGMATAMREAAHALPATTAGPLIDTCGTGGDGSHAINVSTAAALVVAATGAKVVKHGNRSVSSKSGSADVLEALGLSLPVDPDGAARSLDEHGFTFLFAPVFHPAMKAVVPVRRAMGVRTVFNILGPLTNPAAPAHQLVGAFSVDAARLMADALSGLAVQRAFVVHGAPHWDEATPMGPFHRFDVRPDTVEHEVVDPLETYGIPRCAASDLAGGDADHNAAALRHVFEGERGPQRDAVLLNAALCLELLGRGSGRDAVAIAAEAVDSGAVLGLLDGLSS